MPRQIGRRHTQCKSHVSQPHLLFREFDAIQEKIPFRRSNAAAGQEQPPHAPQQVSYIGALRLNFLSNITDGAIQARFFTIAHINSHALDYKCRRRKRYEEDNVGNPHAA